MSPKTFPLKPALKEMLSDLPLSAEIYWRLVQSGKPLNRSFTLEQLEGWLPEWRQQVAKAAEGAQPGKKILIFSALHYWISHATLLGMALAGLGHEVTLGYLPYGKWQKPIKRFDLRRQNIYTKGVLRRASPFVTEVSFLDGFPTSEAFPSELESAVEEVSLRDTQYTLQVEKVSTKSSLYRLRLDRNFQAARAAYSWIKANQPQSVIIPNGTIMEFGSVYQVSRYLQIPTVTYEFGEQRGCVWLAQNGEVMRQQTSDLWEALGGQELTSDQLKQVRSLFKARQKGKLWQNFARRWQGMPSQGGQEVRTALGLDQRPIVLVATNVIGDSLTLGRQVFSDSMTGWLERTMQYFGTHPDVQVVVRIHPGELVTKGPSVAGIVRQVLPSLPDHIHLIPADAKVNTYDLIEIADIGLVYTTTVGLEMATSGLPTVVVGQTHYRGKGFTLDPASWEAYFELLDQILVQPEKYHLSDQQVQRAWEYAYRFFFEYPHPFPWHLVHMWEDVKEWSMRKVLSDEGQERFGKTFRYLSGEQIDWTDIDRNRAQ